MRSEDAVEAVNKSIFKPGWKPTAYVLDGPFIYAGFLVDTYDTSYPDADGKFRKPMSIPVLDVIDCDNIADERELHYRLLMIAQESNIHEDREFLQIRQPNGTFRSLLHPHTDDGNWAWRRFERQKRTLVA